MVRLMAALMIAFAFTACKKEAGEGGTSTITGKIKVLDYDNAGNLQGEYYGIEERVYITYGNNSVYDDWMRTGPDGSYKFEYLNKGTYTIFAYSDCNNCDAGLEPIIQVVDVSTNRSEVTVPEITVIR